MNRTRPLAGIRELMTTPFKPALAYPTSNSQSLVSEQLVQVTDRDPVDLSDHARCQVRVAKPLLDEVMDPHLHDSLVGLGRDQRIS